MIPRDVKSPTAAIPFHKLLKIVAIVDDSNPLTRTLLEQIAAEGYEIEIADSPDRDVSEDAAVGVYRVGRRWRPEGARRLARAVRAIDPHACGRWLIPSTRGHIVLPRRARSTAISTSGSKPAFYAKQVVASLLMYGKTLLPPFFGGLMAYDGGQHRLRLP